MSSEEGEEMYCSKCNNQTDYSLILSCNHNLCISCAEKMLKVQHIKADNLTQFIKCYKCNSLTELEPETIKQILEGGYENIEEENQFNYINKNNEEKELMNNKINIYNNNYMNSEEINNDFNNNFNNENNQIIINKENKNNNNMNIKNNKNVENNNISTSEINIINELSQNNIKQLCKEHSEPLTYLCLDCLSNCICAECVVHGIHKNHEVLNIKKAYPLIFKKLGDLSKYANDQKSSIFLLNEVLTKKKNLVNTLIDRCKNEIHNTFEQIKIRLDNKEKEIIDNTTSVLYKNIEEMNNFENEMKQNSTKLEEINEKINNILKKKDELNTINFFCENKNKIIHECELNEINSIPDFDNFTNIKIEPNLFTFNNMLEGINNFNFEITNIQGIESNNKRKNTKKIPKNKVKRTNYDDMNYNNNINHFNNFPNDNINNLSMFNNKTKQNISNSFQNQFPNNNNVKRKRPRTAKSNKRKGYNNMMQINNIDNYPINLNQNMQNYQNNSNQNNQDFQNNMNQNIENIGTYEINNYNFENGNNLY